ncbi:hypothetical protein [Microbispora sp. H10836]|uniref:hypothetical protein n=1 Tax=Microbispora sp. H10836 TaxID=2729106 RepID=UPI0014767BC2|nr:hypothetical protein [Microbispora sp. H10836]
MPITHALTRSPGRLPRRPAPVAVTLAAVLALAPVNAYAAVAGDGNGNRSAVRVGNGSANRTMVAIGSTRLRGVLHQLSTGVGGVSSVQGGLCRQRARFCALSQNIRARSDGPGDRRAADR